MLISASSTLTAVFWLYFLLSQFGKHPQGENGGGFEAHLLVSSPSRNTVLCLWSNTKKQLFHLLFPVLYPSLWHKNKLFGSDQNQSLECSVLLFVSSHGLWVSFWSGLCLAFQFYHKTCATWILTNLMHRGTLKQLHTLMFQTMNYFQFFKGVGAFPSRGSLHDRFFATPHASSLWSLGPFLSLWISFNTTSPGAWLLCSQQQPTLSSKTL